MSVRHQREQVAGAAERRLSTAKSVFVPAYANATLAEKLFAICWW
jgi:hypothetical protein